MISREFIKNQLAVVCNYFIANVIVLFDKCVDSKVYGKSVRDSNLESRKSLTIVDWLVFNCLIFSSGFKTTKNIMIDSKYTMPLLFHEANNLIII